MDLRELATFRLAAQTLSFTRTADLLGYAQSSVTAQMQALEQEFGVPLFNRLGRRITLTEAGERLAEYAERMLNLAAEAHAAVTAEAQISGSPCHAPAARTTEKSSIGGTEASADYPRTRIARAYRSSKPAR